MRNRDLVPSLNALAEFSKAAKDGPIRRSFAISRTIKTLNGRLEELNEAYKLIVLDGAKRDEAGNPVHPNDANGNPDLNQTILIDAAKTQAKLIELQDIELDDFKPTPFQLVDLEKDGVKLSADILMALDWLIIDG